MRGHEPIRTLIVDYTNCLMPDHGPLQGHKIFKLKSFPRWARTQNHKRSANGCQDESIRTMGGLRSRHWHHGCCHPHWPHKSVIKFACRTFNCFLMNEGAKIILYSIQQQPGTAAAFHRHPVSVAQGAKGQRHQHKGSVPAGCPARCIFQCFFLSTLFACQPCEKLYFCAVGLCVPPKI